MTSALTNCRKVARHKHHRDDHVARQAKVPIATNARAGRATANAARDAPAATQCCPTPTMRPMP
eukprot:10304350-Alexandrium_andersonii.AAC.1